MQVQIVPQKFIHASWEKVAPHIEAAIAYGHGEDTLEQIKVHLALETLQLLVAVDGDNEIQGAATIRYINRSNDRVAFVTAIGGKLITNADAIRQFLALMRNEGATTIEGAVRESVARLWRTKLGAREKYRIVEVPL